MSQRTFWDEPRPSGFQCSECSEKVPDADEGIAFDQVCKKCGHALHCCRSCTYFDSSADKECRQAIPERIAKKRENNRCELFEPVLVVDLKGSTEGKRSVDQARQAFDDLFDF